MGILKKYLFLLILLSGTACSHTLDYMGMVYTETGIEDRFEQSLEWNAGEQRTLPAPAGAYRLIFTGDSHMGGTVNLLKVFNVAAAEDAVLMTIAGDVTTGNEEDYETAYALLSDDHPFDIAVVAGNHDIYFGGWEFYHEYFGSSSYTIEIQSGTSTDLLIFLDSASGTLGNRQFDWLSAILEKRSDYRYVLVCTHLNFFRNRLTASTNPLNQELLSLLDLFEKNKVNFVVSGHDHLRNIEQFGHSTYITLDALEDDFSFASYLDVEIGPSGITYNFMEL